MQMSSQLITTLSTKLNETDYLNSSFSGVTIAGTSGIWTVTITLTNFNGDDSFSLSEGD